jgi:hypothetical protein
LEPLEKTFPLDPIAGQIKTPTEGLSYTPTLPTLTRCDCPSRVVGEVISTGDGSALDSEEKIKTVELRHINKFNERLLSFTSIRDFAAKKEAILGLCNLLDPLKYSEHTESELGMPFSSFEDSVKFYAKSLPPTRTTLSENLHSIEREALILELICADFFSVWLSTYEDFKKFTDELKDSESLFENQYSDKGLVKQTLELTAKMTRAKTGHKQSKKIERSFKNELRAIKKESLLVFSEGETKPALKAIFSDRFLEIKALADAANPLKEGVITTALQSIHRMISFKMQSSELSELSNLEKSILNLKDSISLTSNNLERLPKILRFLQYLPLYLLQTSKPKLIEVLRSEKCIPLIVNLKIKELSSELNLPYDFYQKFSDSSNEMLKILRSQLTSINVLNEAVYHEGIKICKRLHKLTSAAQTFLLPNMEKILKVKKICISAIKTEALRAATLRPLSEEFSEDPKTATPSRLSPFAGAGSGLSSTPSVSSTSAGSDSDPSPSEEISSPPMYRSIQNIEFILGLIRSDAAGSHFAFHIFNLISSISVLFEEIVGGHSLISVRREELSEKLFSTLEELNRAEIHSRRSFTYFSPSRRGIVSEILGLAILNDPENFNTLAVKFNEFAKDCKHAFSEITGGFNLNLPDINPPTSFGGPCISEDLSSILEIAQKRESRDIEWNILRLNSILKNEPSKEAFTAKYGLSIHLIFIIAEEFIYLKDSCLDRKTLSHNLHQYLKESALISSDLMTWFKNIYKESVASRFYDEEKSASTEIHRSIAASFAPIVTVKPKVTAETWTIAESSGIKDMRRILESHLLNLRDFVKALSI